MISIYQAGYPANGKMNKMAKKEKQKAQGLVIPWETADQITLASLNNHRDYLKSELKKWKKDPKTDINPGGYWMHPEDVTRNTVIITYMDEIIKYYGG